MILETERLILREFTHSDTSFILKLLNTPNWLKFIGDKDVHNLNDAESYLLKGPITSYKENGFGLWLVSLKESEEPIGMCGLIKRDYLDDIDIGFALMPNFEGLGYGYEMAAGTVEFAGRELKIDKIIAITDVNNFSSIKLLNKLGLHFKKNIITPYANTVSLFS